MGWGSRFWVWKSKLSSKIIAVNQDIIDLYLHEMKHKVVRFPLAIDTQVYKPNAITSEISKSTFFGKEDFVILSIANLVEVKGIEILIPAVEALEDKHIKVLIKASILDKMLSQKLHIFIEIDKYCKQF